MWQYLVKAKKLWTCSRLLMGSWKTKGKVMIDDEYAIQSTDAKLVAILNMAFDFTSMARVFESGTKKRFLGQIQHLLLKLTNVNEPEEFNKLHDKFCKWGTDTIKKSGRSEQDNASYGQIAKTLNVVLKVAVYYCNLPDVIQAKNLTPLLHPAIDNPMMKHLKKNYRRDFPKKTQTIASVDRDKYRHLLKLAAKDIQDNFNEPIWLIQWEDILWVNTNFK